MLFSARLFGLIGHTKVPVLKRRRKSPWKLRSSKSSLSPSTICKKCRYWDSQQLHRTPNATSGQQAWRRFLCSELAEDGRGVDRHAPPGAWLTLLFYFWHFNCPFVKSGALPNCARKKGHTNTVHSVGLVQRNTCVTVSHWMSLYDYNYTWVKCISSWKICSTSNN